MLNLGALSRTLDLKTQYQISQYKLLSYLFVRSLYGVE
jgi:hypothetical protein